MPIVGKGWELLVERHSVQTNAAGRQRTVGTYQVFHDGAPAGPVDVDGITTPLSGATAEAPNPSQNEKPATAGHPSRILPTRYRLTASDGPHYTTFGYRSDLQIEYPMPGIELWHADTGGRSDILIHPGKNAFLSSIGCINPCTALPDAAELIEYSGSRRRVIALIDDMANFVGGLPGIGSVIANAWVIVEGDPT